MCPAAQRGAAQLCVFLVPGCRMVLQAGPGGLQQQHCPTLEGVYLRGPEEIPHSMAAFQSSALSWDLCWYKTSTASPFAGEPGLCPRAAWLQGQECSLHLAVLSFAGGTQPSHNTDNHQWEMLRSKKWNHCCLSFSSQNIFSFSSAELKASHTWLVAGKY